MVTAATSPSRPEKGIIRIGVTRHLDGETLLAGFRVSATTIPLVAGGIEVCVGWNFNTCTRSILAFVALQTVPTTAEDAGAGMTRQCARSRLGRDAP